MRRCGHNPTDIEVSDIINKIHDDSGSLDLEVRFFSRANIKIYPNCQYTFQDFYSIIENRSHDTDPETGYKVCFGN